MKSTSILLSLFLLISILPVLNSCRKPTDSSGNIGQRPHVVIFLIDTLRADHLKTYGYHKETAPNITALAKRGVVFKSAYSCAPWTLPSVVSLMTSRFPSGHRVVVDSQRISDSDEVLAEHLKHLGYRTGSFFENVYSGRIAGLDRGYDTIEYLKKGLITEKEKQKLKKGWEGRVEFFSRRISLWLDQFKGQPFFLFIHIVNPHNPWEASFHSRKRMGKVDWAGSKTIRDYHYAYRRLTRAGFETRQLPEAIDNTAEQQEYLQKLMVSRDTGVKLYDAAVMDADIKTGTVINILKQRDLWVNTLFIVLSDHGDEMGEHGAWQHDQSVYNELIHVPLVIHFPRDNFSSTVVNDCVRLIDIAPTIMDYLGTGQIPTQWVGKSLLPLLNKKQPGSDGFIITSQRINLKKYYKPHYQERGNVNIVIRKGDWKGIWNVENNRFELYRIKDDPGEKCNLSSGHGKLINRMKVFAQKRFGIIKTNSFKRTRQGTKLTKDQEDNLKSLGYL